MARKKVNLAWIGNDSTRRATFKKRKKGLMKKVSELATLCNVKACMIIYGPQEQQPEAWPSAQEAARLLERFKSMPEMEKCRKMMDQEGFLRQRAAKLQEQLRRQERDNRELEVSLLMHQAVAGRSLYDVNIEDATSLAWMVDAKLKSVQDRINQQTTQLALRSAAESSATSQVTAKDPIEMAMDSLQRQNWLLDAMHPSENVIFGGGGGEEIMPISCVEHNSSWLDLYFPFN